MAKTLVIVESPAKAKTINKYLPKGYTVQATMGHVRDLPKSKLGIDLENDFEPSYVTIRGKGDILKKMKSEAKKADLVLLATDPDREGEAISWHIANYLNLTKEKSGRIEFHEITKNAVRNAIKNQREIHQDLVDAQQARRILDRLVGYSISPLLWKKIKKGLSAGRVQSVATRMIVDREKEILDFVSKEYWTLQLEVGKQQDQGDTFTARYHGIKGKKKDIASEEEVNKILEAVKTHPLLVVDVKKGKKNRKPPNPFTTSTLQQEAFKKLNFTTKKTMSIAQQLYEGLNVTGRGSIGLITYMRTDSIRISDEARNQARNYIEQTFGKEYLGGAAVKNKGKNIQDAHEAIRATDVMLDPRTVKDSLKRDQYRLYKLIWDRFVASQMANGVYDTTSVDMQCDIYGFKASDSQLVFKGFMKTYDLGEDEEDEAEGSKSKGKIPELAANDPLYMKKFDKEQKFTQPPPRYTEATLVKTMEEKGIGRPSTYSPTIQTIRARGYVESVDKKFQPTELGIMITELMEEYFKSIVDYDFTADMEATLDKIADGGTRWQEIIGHFYKDFEKDLKHAEKVMEKIVIEDPVSDVQCDKCGRMMVIKNGRYGKFLACPGFPECRNTKTIVEDLGIPCPECEDGSIVQKKSKKGRIFYGCTNYPDCNFMVWDKPVKDEKCPKCSSLLLQKGYSKMTKIYCSNDECDFVKKKE
ncbi:type I DNA topoisomerase [Alkalibacter rhizosphaerae]|uniref:DNA topoisomerase 1 n=1 Tax=Alkalibacter rhizosphaerae TaxID=2815577 RepID=A0A974XFB5_9FIRM|nr:type I DNA topoisomerase [Alkalibacter rhizosphaerae]QSX08711.1 type I DNA topoisomerase [Alkalibacter rhizosphaerae]